MATVCTICSPDILFLSTRYLPACVYMPRCGPNTTSSPSTAAIAGTSMVLESFGLRRRMPGCARSNTETLSACLATFFSRLYSSFLIMPENLLAESEDSEKAAGLLKPLRRWFWHTSLEDSHMDRGGLFLRVMVPSARIVNLEAVAVSPLLESSPPSEAAAASRGATLPSPCSSEVDADREVRHETLPSCLEAAVEASPSTAALEECRLPLLLLWAEAVRCLPAAAEALLPLPGCLPPLTLPPALGLPEALLGRLPAG